MPKPKNIHRPEVTAHILNALRDVFYTKISKNLEETTKLNELLLAFVIKNPEFLETQAFEIVDYLIQSRLSLLSEAIKLIRGLTYLIWMQNKQNFRILLNTESVETKILKIVVLLISTFAIILFLEFIILSYSKKGKRYLLRFWRAFLALKEAIRRMLLEWAALAARRRKAARKAARKVALAYATLTYATYLTKQFIITPTQNCPPQTVLEDTKKYSQERYLSLGKKQKISFDLLMQKKEEQRKQKIKIRLFASIPSDYYEYELPGRDVNINGPSIGVYSELKLGGETFLPELYPSVDLDFKNVFPDLEPRIKSNGENPEPDFLIVQDSKGETSF